MHAINRGSLTVLQQWCHLFSVEDIGQKPKLNSFIKAAALKLFCCKSVVV